LTDRNFNELLYDRSKVTQNQNRSIKFFCKRNLQLVKSYIEPEPIGHIFFKRNLRSVNVTQKTEPNSIDHCIILKDKAMDRFLWLIVKINLFKKKNLIY
jgi:hypothetical protein